MESQLGALTYECLVVYLAVEVEGLFAYIQLAYTLDTRVQGTAILIYYFFASWQKQGLLKKFEHDCLIH